MDGSTSHFLRDLPAASTIGDVFGLGRSDGILYVEDFDAPASGPEPEDIPQPPPEPAPAVFSAEDVAAAHEAGRREGVQSALGDARLLQEQLQTAALQSLADALANARDALERVATRQAEGCARTTLALLCAAVPATMARHAPAELDAVIAALRPGLACEPELRVRTHPDLTDHVRDTLIEALAGENVVLSVAPDAALAPGDIGIAWCDGSARRDGAAIYREIRQALAPLGLPAPEEILNGK
jgi:hypothetical protein